MAASCLRTVPQPPPLHHFSGAPALPPDFSSSNNTSRKDSMSGSNIIGHRKQPRDFVSCSSCEVSRRMRRPSLRPTIPTAQVLPLQAFRLLALKCRISGCHRARAHDLRVRLPVGEPPEPGRAPRSLVSQVGRGRAFKGACWTLVDRLDSWNSVYYIHANVFAVDTENITGLQCCYKSYPSFTSATVDIPTCIRQRK